MDRPRTYAYGTPIVLLVVFVLSFLACVSIPISQSITLFDLDIRQADAGIRAGLWGYCVPDSTVHGLQCSKPRIGWTLENTLTSDTCPFPSSSSTNARICTGVLNDLGSLIPSGLTNALLIHVVATVLAFVTFVLALVFALRPDLHQQLGNRLRYSNSNERLAQTIASLFLPLLFTLQLAVQISIALILDIVVVSIAKRNATKSEVTVTYGSVTWITLVSAILVWGVLAIQIAKRPRNKASRSRQRREIFDLRSSRTSRLSTSSSSPRSLQSRSLTTPSQSDAFGAAESFTDQSQNAAKSQAPGRSTSLFCCGVGRSRKPRELLVPEDRDDVPTTPSTPPQHRRFSWEPHEEDESYSPSDAHSDSTNEYKQHHNQSAQSPIFACLPCLKRSRPNSEPPEEIELQDIVVSEVQDDSSSVYSQSAASVQEMRYGTSDVGPNSTSNHENKPVARPSYLTWPNIRKALQEMFTLKDGKNDLPGDNLKGEEQGDVSENTETQSFDEQGVIRDEVAEDRRLEEAINESPAQERVLEINKSSADDVPPTDDKVLPEERQEVQSDHESDQEEAVVNEVAPEETFELINDVEPAIGSWPELGDTDEAEAHPAEVMEDDASGPSDEEPTELVDKAGAEPEDEISDDTEGVLGENFLAEEDSAPASADEELQKWDNATEYETVTEDAADEEVGPEMIFEEDEPTTEPYSENVDSDSGGDPSSQEGDCLQKEVDATSDSEKVEVSCREADEVRPDEHAVKRHSFVEVMENIPGRPLVCTACGAYIFVNIKGVH